MTLTSFIHDYANDLANWWQIRLGKFRDIEALRTMSDNEIEDVSGEMGLTRGQLEALVKAGPEAAAEIDRMMVAIDINPVAVQSLQPAMMRDMRVTCANCGKKRVCRHALADGTAANALTSFCPNSDSLVELAKRPELCSA